MNQASSILKDINNRDESERSLRPLSFAEFTGQEEVCANLKVYVDATRKRQETLDHVLLYGPPGLGKTTLAQIIAQELGVNFRMTSGPILTKAGDLAAILSNLQESDVLFIDEIHRLNMVVEETLYSAMEDFKLDIMLGEGPAARSIRLDLPKFTLIGATTRSGLLSQPLRERFGIPLRMQFYSPQNLSKIINRLSHLLETKIDEDACYEIAKRSRGTPRIAGRLFRRTRDFWTLSGNDSITKDIAMQALDRLGVDPLGLDTQDLKYLRLLSDFYQGGPAGVETLAAALGEERDTIEETIEPYLIQQGFVQRTPRGRVLTPIAYQHLGIFLKNNNHTGDE